MATATSPKTENRDPLANARKQLAHIAEIINLDPGMHSRLSYPDRVVMTNSPVRMDDGSIRMFQGFRIQHNNALGPYKGGLRFHPQVNIDEVTTLAMLMSWKCSLAGLPYGGAKGGITVDPRQISLGELERLTRRFASDMVNVFDPKKDIPAPDVNTTSREMAWIMDTWSVNHGYAAPGVVTGKPICIGGSLGRNEATARGAVITLMETLKFMGRELKNEKILIQGFGNLGSIAAELLNDLGATVVGVNDVDGCIYNEKGLNIPEVLKFAKAKGTVSGYPEANPVSHEDFVTMPCTVLIPAALENAIHDGNVDKIKAEIIIEGANAPITASAEETLLKRGVTVVPDILANSGGVIVSYFEWVQGMSELFWTEKEVNDKLTQLMVRNFGSVSNVVKEKKLSFRMAAYALAVGRVAEALKTRGIYP